MLSTSPISRQGVAKCYAFLLSKKRGEITKYKTIQGDTWDIIAKKVYGKEKYLDYLMKNNYELLEYFIFPAGIELNIPELPEETNSDLPKWRQV